MPKARGVPAVPLVRKLPSEATARAVLERAQKARALDKASKQRKSNLSECGEPLRVGRDDIENHLANGGEDMFLPILLALGHELCRVLRQMVFLFSGVTEASHAQHLQLRRPRPRPDVHAALEQRGGVAGIDEGAALGLGLRQRVDGLWRWCLAPRLHLSLSLTLT